MSTAALFAFVTALVDDVLARFPGLAGAWVEIEEAHWHYDEAGQRVPDYLIKQAHQDEKAFRDATRVRARA